MSASKSSQPSESAWDRFSRQFPRCEHLTQDRLYALPAALIAAICECAPTFWTNAQARFERSLAHWSGHGFLRKESFMHPLLDSSAVPAMERQFGRTQQRQAAALDRLLAGEMQRSGKHERAFERYRQQSDRLQRRARNCARAYLGWLLADPEFQQEYAALADRWPTRIWRVDAFPSIPMSFFGESPPPTRKQDRGFVAEARLFLQQWCLQTMVTPELPLPILPQLASPNAYDPAWLGQSGVSLFIPNYLFRERTLSLTEVTDLDQSFGHLNHLAGWLQKRPPGWGNERFGRMLDLYVYWGLAIEKRYPDSLDGHTSELDRAFAAYWHLVDGRNGRAVSEDSVRKIRQKLQQLVRSRLLSNQSSQTAGRKAAR